MSKFEWKPEYSVGNEAIDGDHRGLFALVRELEDADMSDGLLDTILARLEDYAEGHFAREEAYMQKVGYPNFNEHVKEHKAFVEWLETVQITYRRAAESPFVVGDMVNDYLERWLVEHILEEDMQYRDFIVSAKQQN
jgi:hemerythrin